MRNATVALAAIAALAGGESALAQLPSKPVLNLQASQTVMDAAEAHARANGWNVVITIVDDGGHPILLRRMDGTQIGSVEVALEKARSAVAFRRPTRALNELVSAGNVAVLRLPGAMPVEGGIPLMWEGQMIGAIGVSGVTAQQDGQIAQAGVEALSSAGGP